MFTQAETDFNLDRHLISFLQDSPFFAELSRHIQKTPTRDLPTAAVAYNEKSDEIVMYWNPEFFASLTAKEIRGVITHEYYHLVFGHVQSRRKTPAKLWNIATDLAINSIICDSGNKQYSSHLQGERILPEFCLLPGTFPKHPEGRDFTPEEKHAMKLALIIEKLPTMQSSEWYFEKIKEEAEKDPDGLMQKLGDGEITIGSMDDHEAWDKLPEDQKEYIEGKIKSIVEKATKHADGQANGWGNMPAELVEGIRKSVSNIINWRNVLRQFVGNLVHGGRSTSMKRINKRYPYIHPGVKKGYVAKLLVAIDQSGSVGNEMLVEFFAELGSLTRNVTIDVVPFDTIALEKDRYTWRKGQKVPAKRVRGGTDFNAPTQYANDPKNRGRWDGLLIMTDGEAPSPGPSRIRRGYVLGKGCKMNFATSDVLVKMDNAKQITGAWR